MNESVFEKEIIKMNESNKKIHEEFNIYLNQIKPWITKILEEHKNKFEFFLWFLWEIELFISFTFDKKLIILDYFKEETAITIHRIFWEISGLIWWVKKCLEAWTIIWAFSLLRTILERIIILKVFFEDPDKIDERVKKYNIFWNIEIYKKYKKYKKYWWSDLSQDFISEIEEAYKKEKIFRLYPDNNNVHNYFNWIYWKKTKISYLLKKFWLDIGNMYSILSHINHWWPLNINFLNEKNALLPNDDKEKYINVIKYTVSLLLKVYEDLCKYTKKEDLIVFFQIMYINMDKIEEKLK